VLKDLIAGQKTGEGCGGGNSAAFDQTIGKTASDLIF
jgi:hypothetical protein